MKQTKIIISGIVVLLLLIAGAFSLLQHIRSNDPSGDRTQAVVSLPGKAEAEALAEKSREVFTAVQPDLRSALAGMHVIAHRNVIGEDKEHSFEAYDQAIADGARIIEQDIVISKDHTLYVFHDQTAGRLTGVSKAFSRMTDEEIDSLRTYAGNPVLRLSEVFDHYGTTVEYAIELKSKDRDTAGAFMDLVEQYGFADRIIVQCFDPDILEIIEDRYPDMIKLFLCKYPGLLEQGYEASCVDIISVDYYMMTEERIRRAHEGHKLFSVWPVVTEGETKAAIDAGVDIYFTDNVKQSISLEKGYGFEKRYLSDEQDKESKQKQ